MAEYPFYLVDAFTHEPFQGNRAGVVLDAAGLTENHMQLIAREVGASETTFVLPPTDPRADVRFRWFTPAAEVSMCGHATVAGVHVLVTTG